MTPAHLLPAAPGFPPRQRPAETLESLVGQIPEPGAVLRLSADGVLGVLSLPAVSVWSNGRVLWWWGRGSMRPPGQPPTRPGRPGGWLRCNR